MVGGRPDGQVAHRANPALARCAVPGESHPMLRLGEKVQPLILFRFLVPASMDAAPVGAGLGHVQALPIGGSPRASSRVGRVFDAAHVVPLLLPY